MRKLSRFELGCLAVVAAAFALRAYFVFHPYVIWDSAWYLLLARSFGTYGDFRLPWTDPLQYSGYWPPLFPILASPIVKLFGPSYGTIVLAASLMTLLLTAATLLTTWDLFGRVRGFAAMATVAASPAFLHSDESGMGESTLALMVVLFLWAFLKSLQKPRFLGLAGLFGVLAYFAKPNLGLPLVIAALVPLAAWRIHSRGWQRVARDPIDIGVALAGLGVLVAFSAKRTGRLGSLGVGVIDPLKQALGFPLFVPFLLFKFFFAAAFLLAVTLPFSLQWRRVLKKPDTEAQGYLGIFVLLTLLATALFTTSFLITEKRGPLDYHNVTEAFGRGLGVGLVELTATLARLVDFDNIRYLTPAIVPFLWLLLPHLDIADEPERATEGTHLRARHYRWFALAVCAYVVLLLFNPLAGLSTLGRLVAFCVLALLPLGFALAARGSQYALASKRTAKGVEERRLVPSVPGATRWGTLVGAGALLLFTAYEFSTWFLAVGVGLLIVLSTRDARARIIALGLILLVSTYPAFVTPYPLGEASAVVAEKVTPGALVGTVEPVPYLAAVFPADRTLRVVNDTSNLTQHYDALVMTNAYAAGEYPNFTRVAAWNNTFDLFPTFKWRLAIERGLLGQEFDFPERPGAAVYLPTTRAQNASSLR